MGPGRKIPLHGHSGPEMICVLKGGFSDASGRYESGGFVEVDEQSEHQPTATPEGECRHACGVRAVCFARRGQTG